MLISLEEAKEHLNIEGTAIDDNRVLGYLNAAIAVVERKTMRNPLELSSCEFEMFKQAVLLLLGDYYSRREDTLSGGGSSLPMGVQHLTDLLRDYNR